jgi:TolB-like protein/tetratricopeptide (TPR) repeat protein
MHEVSIVIHPFDQLFSHNATQSFSQSFFTDVVTELSRFRQFRIVTNETLRPDEDPAYSVKGVFRQTREKVRINAQLINNRTGRVVWAETFEEDISSIDAHQHDIAQQLVSSVQLQLNHDVLNTVRRSPDPELGAYGFWLLGMEELRKGTLEADEVAREYFKKSIAVDPAFSLGYSGMSLSYFNEWSCQLWDRWEISQRGAGEWAKKAIELDEDNHIAALVLGRVYLYEAEYEIAENYLRRALRLNNNDNDILIQIASCFVFLGLCDEAEALYNKVLTTKLPYPNKYNHIGAFIAFEKGEFQRCLELAQNANSAWVDFPAIKAAAYFELGDMENMKRCWDDYLELFRSKIRKDNDEDALQWLININPYKFNTRSRNFWEHIGGKTTAPSPRVFMRATPVEPENFILKEGEVWHLSFEGVSLRLPGAKGILDLVKLLSKPEHQFHCTELVGGGIITSAEKAFDEKAKRAYQRRILELREEISRLDEDNDSQRSEALHEEYEGIVEHLKTSLGLRGVIRQANDEMEKTRSAVTWRIRHIIQKIGKHHPAFGKHLNASIKTGLFCSYRPEKPMKWTLNDH